MKAVLIVLMFVVCNLSNADVIDQVSKMNRNGINKVSTCIIKHVNAKSKGRFNKAKLKKEIQAISRKLDSELRTLQNKKLSKRTRNKIIKNATKRKEIARLKKELQANKRAMNKIVSLIDKMSIADAKKLNRIIARSINKVKQNKVRTTSRRQLAINF